MTREELCLLALNHPLAVVATALGASTAPTHITCASCAADAVVSTELSGRPDPETAHRRAEHVLGHMQELRWFERTTTCTQCRRRMRPRA